MDWNKFKSMATEKEKETCKYEKLRRRTMLDFWNRLAALHYQQDLKSDGESRPGPTQTHFEEWNCSTFYLGIFQWCNVFALDLGLFVKERRHRSYTWGHFRSDCRWLLSLKWNMPLWLQVQELSGLLALASAAHQQLKDLKWELGSQNTWLITWKPCPANLYTVYLSVLFLWPYHQQEFVQISI